MPPNVCDANLAALGIRHAPATYGSDYLWDYELGSKNRLDRGRLSFDESIFYIKWYNIEQFVRLPICGQSTILNLGTATSKGFDLDWRAIVARGLLLNLGVSYTDATIDKTVTVPGAINPLIDSGDSIGGAMFSPFQLSAAVEYHHSVLNHEAYVRADYEFHGLGPKPDPRLLGYDPTLPRTPSSGYLAMRMGVDFSNWQLSIYAKNVLNSHVELQRTRQYFTSLYYGFTYRPRTLGLEAIYRLN